MARQGRQGEDETAQDSAENAPEPMVDRVLELERLKGHVARVAQGGLVIERRLRGQRHRYPAVAYPLRSRWNRSPSGRRAGELHEMPAPLNTLETNVMTTPA
jgi:hypothetical protein